MSTTALDRKDSKTETPTARGVDLKLEVAVLPVADIERAKSFYGGLGWRLDADFIRPDGSRAVQFTPPGSPASIHFGSAPANFLVVNDIEAARAELTARGVEVSAIFHPGDGPGGRAGGPDPEGRSYFSLATFSDPDGNTWVLQQVTARLPGRVDPDDTKFVSSQELAAALRRAAKAHGEHEKRNGGQHDANWPDWYAEYMVAEQAGKPLPL
jgi:catechol 2,3-dioxygenase-like lactoylglutathione lyase family enzyme